MSTSAVWDGTNAYIFGGLDRSGSYLDEIVRYNPATDAVATMGGTLPTARLSTSAVWDGTNAYIFGGSRGGLLNEILRYNPATDAVTTMNAALPTARDQTSAVWDGTNAYIFGGISGGGVLSQIVRYNPATDAVTTMNATLPTGRHGTSAVWDGNNAYIFGGSSDGFSLSQIVRYDPTTDSVTTMNAILPTGRFLMSAAWDGAHAFIFGGNGDGETLHQVVRYNPATDAVTTMSATLPTRRHGTSAAWDGTNANIFGGNGEGAGDWNQIVRYNPNSPTAPLNFAAAPGPSPGQITLSWLNASDSGSSPVTGYKVYRGTSSGGETFLTTLGNVRTYTDSGLPEGATRYYRVSAVNAAGEGSLSSEVSATTSAPPGVPGPGGGGGGATAPAQPEPEASRPNESAPCCGTTPFYGSTPDPGDEGREPFWASNPAQTLYWVIGVAGTGAAALYTRVRIRGRRRITSNYLQLIESTLANSKANPETGVPIIGQVRREIRARYHEGRLEDAQFLDLDRRSSEAILRLRGLELEKRFPHLPQALLGEIRQAMAHGGLSPLDLDRIERKAQSLSVPAVTRERLLRVLSGWMETPAPPTTAGKNL